MKKILTVFLALAMVLTLTACGGQSAAPAPSPAPEAAETPAGPAESAPSETVSAPVPDPGGAIPGTVSITLPAGDIVKSAQVMNGRIYIAASDGQDPEAALSPDCSKIYSAALDGSDIKELCTLADDGRAERFAVCPDGSLWLYIWSYDQDTQTSSEIMRHLGADGAELASVDLTALPRPGDISFNGLLPGDGGSVIILSGSNTLITLDSAGNIASDVNVSAGYLSSPIRLEDGRLLSVLVRQALDESVSSLVQVDLSTGGITEIPLSAEGGLGNYATVLTGEGSTLYFTRMSTVYALNMTSGAETELSTWINAGANQYDQRACFVRDGALWTAEAADSSGTVTLFPLRTGEDDRTVLTLAAMRMDGSYTAQVARFNRINAEYRIEVKDYTGDDPWYDHALEKLNYDIISGEIPDMYILDDMPRDTLKNQGLLLDLSDLLAGDETIRMEDYLDKVIDAGREDDGQMPSLFAGFGLSTLAALPGQDVTAENNTPDNFCALQARDPNVAAIECHNGEEAELLSSFVQYDPSLCLDLENGTCSFDSTRFRSLATALSVMPKTVYDGTTGQYVSRAPYRLFSIWLTTFSPGFTDPADVMANPEAMAAGAELPVDQTGSTLVGWPTANGGRYIVQPRFELAISSQTEHAQACWTFLRTFLSEDFQMGQSSLIKGFDLMPVKRSAVQAQADICVRYGAATQEDADALSAILDGDRLQVSNSGLLSDISFILREEMTPYFDGTVPLDTAVADLQSRVGLYLSEHS